MRRNNINVPYLSPWHPEECSKSMTCFRECYGNGREYFFDFPEQVARKSAVQMLTISPMIEANRSPTKVPISPPIRQVRAMFSDLCFMCICFCERIVFFILHLKLYFVKYRHPALTPRICYTLYMFFVYILECKDKTLYVGSTNDLEKDCISTTIPRTARTTPRSAGRSL